MKRARTRKRMHRKKNKTRSRRYRRTLRGGDYGNPTSLSLQGVPLPLNAVAVSPTGTQSLRSYLGDQGTRSRTGYDDGD